MTNRAFKVIELMVKLCDMISELGPQYRKFQDQIMDMADEIENMGDKNE